MIEHQALETHFAVCVRNDGYPASLELRKIYRVIPDATADAHGHVRIIDESGEDYLYPADYFVPITLPKAVEEAISAVP
ncbi:MAG: hypothetical protein JXQ75_07645 [Phycisphaerae bacterium]|nr:hypothetical protein [Phycisphaerae bacterium]